MTMRTMVWAYGLTDISPTAKLIAIAIADRCVDDTTGDAVVSIDGLFEWAGGQISHGDLDRALAEIVKHGVRIRAPDRRGVPLGAMAVDMVFVLPANATGCYDA